jgi:beta-glucosidase
MKEEIRAHIGTWAGDCVVEYGKSIYTAFTEKFGKERVVNKPMDAMRADLFRHSDVVVLALGESEHLSGESHSIANIDLPADQLAFAKQMKMMGKPVVGVMCFARPVALGEAEMYFDAILYAWHGGTCAADAIADVLNGDVNPSGKLPVTIPRSTHQIPLYYNVRPSGRYVDGYYGDTWGNYQDMLPSPLYPFGYGLSYTTFSYSKAELDTPTLSLAELEAGGSFRVSVTVENTGKRDGKEVVQCYINDSVASMVRPIRELRAFRKITLAAGEKKTVTFSLGFEELAFYNAESKLVVEPGKFTVAVGASCYTGNAVTIEVK